MRRRCIDPNFIKFPRYGGRGIKVCKRWDKFENFFADMGPKPTPEHTINRLDNDGNYEPGNCAWATSIEQRVNKPDVRLLTAFGRTQPLQYWADEFNMTAWTLNDRIVNRKMSIEEALTRPLKAPSPILKVGRVSRRISEWSTRTGIPIRTIKYRLENGRSPAEAISEGRFAQRLQTGNHARAKRACR